MPTFRIVPLGCPRNLVDSELIAGSLKDAGYRLTSKKTADICIVNTCAFVEAAREESVDAILQAAIIKKEGRCRVLVVCGCLSQAYGKKLVRQLPEVDLFIGTNDFPRLPYLIRNLSKNRKVEVSRRLDYLYDESYPRTLLVPGHYAYIKITEGCSNSCSYCIISRLRGNLRSRPIESILAETMALVSGGKLKEIDLVGQDTTQYGLDIYGSRKFPELLKNLSGLNTSIEWIRILYTHPAHYTDRFISVVADEPKICKYLDLPIQHINDGILRRMRRNISRIDIERLIDKLRRRINGLALRTSIIVGFPGETDDDFMELMDFVRQTRFERLGAFMYSREEGTEAATMRNQVPSKVVEERMDELMKLQKTISLDRNKRLVGSRFNVLIDEKEEGGSDRFVGRTESDAPDVDGSVYVSGKNIEIGKFYNVKITGADEYDLIGKVQ